MEIRRPSSSSNISSIEQKQEQKSESSLKQINSGISKAQDSFEAVKKNPLLDSLLGETAKRTDAAESTTAASSNPEAADAFPISSTGTGAAEGSATSAPGTGNNPIATDTSSNPPNDVETGSQMLRDVASAYNQMEQSVESMFSKLKAKAKDDEGSKARTPSLPTDERDLRRIKIED